jgi:hypothetical protein
VADLSQSFIDMICPQIVSVAFLRRDSRDEDSSTRKAAVGSIQKRIKKGYN